MTTKEQQKLKRIQIKILLKQCVNPYIPKDKSQNAQPT